MNDQLKAELNFIVAAELAKEAKKRLEKQLGIR